MRLWVDTDIGDNPDDAVALAAAVAHPLVELVGVSTVSGDVVARAEHAHELLRRIGAPDVLIYAGPPDPRALAAAEALLAIGPLTNLAALIRKGTELPPLAAMGGVLDPPVLHRGAHQTVDTNFATDPVAAAVVVHAATDLLLVPLDVTATLTVTNEVANALVSGCPSLAPEIARWRARTLDPLCLSDPCALLALCGEHVVIGRRQVAVTVDGGLLPLDDGAEVEFVLQVDRLALIDRVVTLLTEGD